MLLRLAASAAALSMVASIATATAAPPPPRAAAAPAAQDPRDAQIARLTAIVQVLRQRVSELEDQQDLLRAQQFMDANAKAPPPPAK